MTDEIKEARDTEGWEIRETCVEGDNKKKEIHQKTQRKNMKSEIKPQMHISNKMNGYRDKWTRSHSI